MKCNNCGSKILKGEEFCPVCNCEIKDTYVTKPGRYKKAAAYIINIFFALGAYIFSFIWNTRLSSVKEAVNTYGRFSKEALHTVKYTHLTELWMTVFLVLTLIYTVVSVYFALRKAKNNFSVFGLCFCLLVTVTAGVSSFAYSKNYNERDLIEVIKKDELVYSPVSVHGGTFTPPDEVEFNLYTYYVTFACAYNDLARTGDYKAFFDTVNENNFQNLSYHLDELKNIYLSGGEPYPLVTDVAFLPGEIPYQSIDKGKIPSNHEINEALKYSSDGKTKDKLVEKYVERANILFDIFYGKELICEKAISYDALKYKGEFTNPNGRSNLKINTLTLNKDGSGETEFYYSPVNATIKGKITNRKCAFEYSNEYGSGRGLLHITQNCVIVNISEENSPGFSKSDSFPLSN